MRKNIFKSFTVALACCLSISMVGCSLGGGGNSSSSPLPSVVPEPVEAQVKFAYAEDKIYQSYDREVDGQVDVALSAQGEEYMSKLMDGFSLSAFKNETESRQMIITPSADVANYDLTVSDFKCGEKVLSSTAFSLGHEYYHNVYSVMDKNTNMSAGMIPDAIIPLEYAKSNGLNKISANENQGIYITVAVPKDQAAGVYTGTFTLTLDGTEYDFTGTVTVLDYTLPDEVVARSCMVINGMPIDNLMYMEGDGSQEMYWKYVEMLGEFRLSAQYMYGMKIDATSIEEVEVLADEHVTYMLQAAQNPKISTYSIRTNGKWATPEGFSTQQATLDEEYFMVYTKKMVEATLREGVDLFKKATVYMGSIIDEPEDTVGAGIVDYVCEQFHSCQRETVKYLEEILASAEKASNVDDAFIEQVKASILDMTNIVTTSSEPSQFEQVDSYCPKIATPGGRIAEPVGSSARLEDYADLKNQTTSNGRTKDFWWYTHQTPYYPNPTLHLDDNGVSARMMYWMMSEYDIKGYLLWETVMTTSLDGQLKGWELYDNVIRDSVSAGDAFMFYPGKLLGMDTPVPSVRLYYMRDGIEDYDAIYDLKNNLYASLGEKYAAALSADGALNELYASMYTLNKTYATSAELATSRSALEALLVWANHGIAISDFSISASGKVTANIYVPTGASISVNGKTLTGGTASGEGVVYSVSETADKFTVSAEGMSISIDTKVGDIFTASSDAFAAYKVADGVTTVDDSVQFAVEEGCVSFALQSSNTSFDYILQSGAIDSNTSSLIIVLDYDGEDKTEMAIGFKGALVAGSLDTVYMHPGENVIRIDRLNDLNWNVLQEIKRLTFTPESDHGGFTVKIKNISIIG